jgi:nuclear pore complex protein Nup62
LSLEEELRAAVAAQEALERRLSMLETHQRGIHEALTGMEGEAERLYREELPLLDDEGRERDGLYSRAEAVGGALASLGEQLKGAIEDINVSAAAKLGDGDAPLAKAVRVLNSQLQALAQVDARTEELEGRLSGLKSCGGR